MEGSALNVAVRHRILVVDDDEAICDVLQDVLAAAGFVSQAVHDGPAMLAALARQAFSLVLIDLKLRHEDGLELARALRRRSRIPIIMLTGRGDVTDQVLGLETAADDFVFKPFNHRELVARIRALLRRASETAGGRAGVSDALGHERYRFAGWVVNLTQRSLRHDDGTPCPLTQGEFALLEVFVTLPNRVISREALIAKTRGTMSEASDRTIDVLIVRLRKKIEDNPAHPQLVLTERGFGYRLAADVARC